LERSRDSGGTESDFQELVEAAHPAATPIQLRDQIGNPCREITIEELKTDALRTTADVRSKVQQGMAEIAATLDTMVIKKGVRKSRADED
jgi:hypothetical protein